MLVRRCLRKSGDSSGVRGRFRSCCILPANVAGGRRRQQACISQVGRGGNASWGDLLVMKHQLKGFRRCSAVGKGLNKFSEPLPLKPLTPRQPPPSAQPLHAAKPFQLGACMTQTAGLRRPGASSEHTHTCTCTCTHTCVLAALHPHHPPQCASC